MSAADVEVHGKIEAASTIFVPSRGRDRLIVALLILAGALVGLAYPVVAILLATFAPPVGGRAVRVLRAFLWLAFAVATISSDATMLLIQAITYAGAIWFVALWADGTRELYEGERA